ncbi:MAG: DUF1189 family protein [Turicibacter sp.]|nr:DUF1189 family protein [Turicibacter sp.]
MNKLKLMLQTTYSIDAIFALKKTPILISLLFLIVLGCMQMTPFAFIFISDDPYRWDQRIWELSETDQEQFVSALPEGCRVEDYKLTCSDFTEIKLSNDVKVLFNGDANEITNGVVFNEDRLVFVEQNRKYEVGYSYFEGLNFDDASYEDVFARVAKSIKPLFVVSFVLGAYQSGIFSSFIFVLVVSALSMLLKFGHTSFLSYKEVLNIVIYSATFPCVMALVIGILFNPGFTTLIFNFGTPLVAYFVYRCRVIPYLIEN